MNLRSSYESRPTTESIRRLPPSQRLAAAIDANMLWENVEAAWDAGADIQAVSPGGATAWTGLAALVDAWCEHSGHWRMPDGEYHVRYLLQQSERLLEAGVPVDGNTVPGASRHSVSFLECLARNTRRTGSFCDPLIERLLQAGANPQRPDAWHTAVEWTERDTRPDHPLRVWHIEHEAKVLHESLNAEVSPVHHVRTRM